MKKLIIWILLLGIFSTVSAQTMQKLEIKYERVGDGLFDFYTINNNFFPMQLELNFTEFDNMSSNRDVPFIATIQPGRHYIFTVSRVLLDLPGEFKYNFTTRVGAFPVIHNNEVVYQLPIEVGKSTLVNLIGVTGTAQGRILWSFEMKEDDVVTASREGVVCQLTHIQMRDSMQVGDNTITILHPDQTFGKYELLADSSFMVDLGDSVKIGEPLAKAGISRFAKTPQTRFSVYYVNSRIDSIITYHVRNIYDFVDPKFTDSEGEPFNLISGAAYSR